MPFGQRDVVGAEQWTEITRAEAFLANELYTIILGLSSSFTSKNVSLLQISTSNHIKVLKKKSWIVNNSRPNNSENHFGINNKLSRRHQSTEILRTTEQ